MRAPGERGPAGGIHQRPSDLAVNICKRKAATNVRSNKEQTIVLSPPKVLSLDDNMEYISNEELVEVRPSSPLPPPGSQPRPRTGRANKRTNAPQGFPFLSMVLVGW